MKVKYKEMLLLSHTVFVVAVHAEVSLSAWVQRIHGVQGTFPLAENPFPDSHGIGSQQI